MSILENSKKYLEFLENWQTSLPIFSLTEALSDLKPEQIAIISVDLLEGFCRIGPLSSEKVAQIIPNITQLMQKANHFGIKNIALAEDYHPIDTEEFESYPPHCQIGSEEARRVSELEMLDNFSDFKIFKKNSISAFENTELIEWLNNLDLKLIFAVGDVTDLCLYTMALGLKLRSIARNLGIKVVVPENCTQTWEAIDHPSELYHALFLHQLSRNGVEVVAKVV